MKEPGRELDAEIAVKVMGIVVQPITVIDGFGPHADVGTVGKPYLMSDGRMGVEAKRLPAYSTDIAAAWLVVEKLMQTYWMFSVNQREAGWWVVLYPQLGPAIETEYASTAPHAICLAALAAVGEG